MSFGYQPSRLFQHEVFNDAELGQLHALAESAPLRELINNPRWKEESAIDFVCTSAQIEGNTYTRAETITLLKMGKTAGKRYADAVMIMNLRATYDYILENAAKVLVDPLGELTRYHSILMRELLLDSELGAARKTRGVMIGGSEYMPLSGADQLSKQLSLLLDEMGKTKDCFNKSVYAACNLAYLQYFEDGNKRTSRVFQNAILMANDLPPVLFSPDSIADYIDSTLYYYESGDYATHRRFTIDAYERSYGQPLIDHERPPK